MPGTPSGGGSGYSASNASSLGLADQLNDETNFIFGNANSLSQSATQTPTQDPTATSSAEGPASTVGAASGNGAAASPTYYPSSAGSGGGGFNLTEILLVLIAGMVAFQMFKK